MEYAALLARQRPRDKRAGLPNSACFAIALPASGGYLPDIGCGCSSGVEHNLAKVGVEGSNPFARSKHFNILADHHTAPLRRVSAECPRNLFTGVLLLARVRSMVPPLFETRLHPKKTNVSEQ